MFSSKLLLNRQKIFNPGEIHEALSRYFPQSGKSEKEHEPSFFYRLEWYRIGVVVPLLVYSHKRPELLNFPECQLISVDELSPIPETKQLSFSIFAVPDLKSWDPSETPEKIKNWLQKKLDKSATIQECELGPNNCIYYQDKNSEKSQQTVTIKGELKVANSHALDLLRQKPLGRFHHLGCGLLQLQQAN